MQLIKTERPQEVIQKSLHGLMTDLGLGMFCQKNQLFCGKTFYKGNLFLTNEKEEKHKNAYPLFCSLEFYCFFSSSLIAPM